MATTPQTRKAISLFSGCGGDTLGLERAGFKVVAFNEFNKAAIDTHLSNFPDSVLITENEKGGADITKVPDAKFEPYKGQIDVVFAGFPCFTAGTPVLTNSGYKSIETVTLDDKLLSHTGKFQSIVNLQRKVYSDTLYDFRIKYHPVPITATKEHPFYVRRKVRTWNNEKRKYEVSFESPKWKEANTLTTDDYFGMVVNTKEVLPTRHVAVPVNQSRIDNVEFVLDKPEQWYMMGYFLGDGHILDTKKADQHRLNHAIRFAVADKDVEKVLPKLRSVLDITDKKNRTGKCASYGCADLTWWTILKEFGKYSHGKKIPEWVQDAPKELIAEFLEGYKDADGCVRPDGTQSFTTVSYDIATGIQRLYLKLGKLASVTKSVRPKTCVIQGRTVNQRDTYQIRCCPRPPKNTSFIENGYAWYAPSKMTTRIVTNEPVYNFEVEEDNSYIVENTIVHNCQGFSTAGKKKVNDPRNQMFRQFVRVVKNTEPPFIIGENVTGLTTMKSGPNEDDPLMLEIIRQAFDEIGYTITYKVLEADEYGVPQSRKRLLIIGWRRATIQSFDPTSFWASVAAWGAQKTSPKLADFVSASLEGALLLDDKAIPPDFANVAIPVSNTVEPTGTPHPYVVLKANEFDATYQDKTYDRLLSCGKRDSPIHSEVLNLTKPSKTIICTYDHQPRLLVGLKKEDGRCYVRTLLPDELKQIQGFPADFVLKGNVKEKVVQVGNAVPPALVEAVATQLRLKLETMSCSTSSASSVVAAQPPSSNVASPVVKKVTKRLKKVIQ